MKSTTTLAAACAAAVLLLSGCATFYSPVVDPNSVGNMDAYRANLAECNRYANQISVGQSVAGGTILGALLGAAIGAAAGDRQSFARFGAVVGAAQGGTASANAAVMTQAQIVRNCLAGRGYVVLDGPVTVPLGGMAHPPAPVSAPPSSSAP
ncbi:MAG: glycine zipper family protein [Burkholderiaceae bacterium]|jgi:uncharacterized protein YcfJ|nr:glycine zipper family protein [Burkholderiaceae bacterium]